ncbi:AfsR/SARP family transcriptional regulator [Streptomyces sp. PmtG]
MHDQRGKLCFRLLGPVSGQAGDEPLNVGSPQQQAVLAMLLLREGRTVSMDELVDGLWGENPPRSEHRAVLTYISRLRTAFDPGRRPGDSSTVLPSMPGGYALRAAGVEVDSVLFEREVADRSGGTRIVHDRLVAALARWRGSPLVGVPGPWAERERNRLEEVRATAREALFGHALDLGMHTTVLPDLQAMVREFPLRERLSELLMLALYRCGRQAEALAVHGAARRALRAELQVEPSAALTTLQRRILAGDPGLMPPTPTATPSRAAVSSAPRHASGGPAAASAASRRRARLHRAHHHGRRDPRRAGQRQRGPRPRGHGVHAQRHGGRGQDHRRRPCRAHAR